MVMFLSHNEYADDLHPPALHSKRSTENERPNQTINKKAIAKPKSKAVHHHHQIAMDDPLHRHGMVPGGIRGAMGMKFDRTTPKPSNFRSGSSLTKFSKYGNNSKDSPLSTPPPAPVVAPPVSNPLSAHRESTPSSHALVPRIILLDMDGTMIGRINPQLCEYEVLSVLNKNKIKQLRADIVVKMRHGIVRPGLKTFCERMNEDSHPTELFVYTASDDKWAKFLVPLIEEAIGFKFNRPLLTRQHCHSVSGDYKKSIAHVAPLIFKTLKGKYPILASSEEARKNTILIDNNHRVMLLPSHVTNSKTVVSREQTDAIAESADRLVKCPTYNYEYHTDVLAKVDPDALKTRFNEIISTLRDFNLYPQRAGGLPSYEVFMAEFFTALAANARYGAAEAEHSLKDEMWKIVGDVLCTSGNNKIFSSRFSPRNRERDTQSPDRNNRSMNYFDRDMHSSSSNKKSNPNSPHLLDSRVADRVSRLLLAEKHNLRKH